MKVEIQKKVWQFLKQLSIELPYDSAIPLLGVYPGEMKTYSHIKTCTGMFITALFIKPKEENKISIN